MYYKIASDVADVKIYKHVQHRGRISIKYNNKNKL